VRRDEATAQVAEKEAERKRRDDEASERLRILRGSQPENKETDGPATIEKKRKRVEEDEPTDHHRDGQRSKFVSKSRGRKDETRDVEGGPQQANVTHEHLDSISNMRFRDAAGRHNGAQRPWYSTATPADPGSNVGKDVWGNEDPGRHTRNQKRLDANDPLLSIKKGVKQLRDVEKQKVEWRKERERDLYEVEDLARKERHRRRREERHKHDRNRDRHRSRRNSDDRKRPRSSDRTGPRENRA